MWRSRAETSGRDVRRATADSRSGQFVQGLLLANREVDYALSLERTLNKSRCRNCTLSKFVRSASSVRQQAFLIGSVLPRSKECLPSSL